MIRAKRRPGTCRAGTSRHLKVPQGGDRKHRSAFAKSYGGLAEAFGGGGRRSTFAVRRSTEAAEVPRSTFEVRRSTVGGRGSAFAKAGGDLDICTQDLSGAWHVRVCEVVSDVQE